MSSDPLIPSAARLRRDQRVYRNLNYLQLPARLDRRISRLASRVIRNARARNRYDKARAIERFLSTQLGYTLEMKAGGPDPLADFLFNVKEGHCEYFSSSMAIMLRTQGIAARVVNGFQRGQFNETAGMFVVKQRDAHSWVEVYFPETDTWVTFDPTPSEGQFNEAADDTVAGTFGGYLDAIEAFWIQYFVSYDSKEQKTLLESAQSRIVNVKDVAANWFEAVKAQLLEWWQRARGDQGFAKQSDCNRFWDRLFDCYSHWNCVADLALSLACGALDMGHFWDLA